MSSLPPPPLSILMLNLRPPSFDEPSSASKVLYKKRLKMGSPSNSRISGYAPKFLEKWKNVRASFLAILLYNQFLREITAKPDGVVFVGVFNAREDMEECFPDVVDEILCKWKPTRSP